MKRLHFILILLSSFSVAAQNDIDPIQDIREFQRKLDEEYKDPKRSPLEPAQLEKFDGHDFFNINLHYRVTAKLTVTDGTPFFGMQTTTSRLSTERIYGYVTFALGEKEFKLPVYQSKDLMEKEEYRDYLFFPFTDKTNNDHTYGGGRYLDLRIPQEGDSLIIDFNKAYNPYCAYSDRFSCPLVPSENHIDTDIFAGVKYFLKDEDAEPESLDNIVIGFVKEAPEYPGGDEALARFLRNNMRYPKEAVRNKVQGTVYVQFVVQPDGSIADIQTINGLSEECDREAMRVVALMPKWKPGKINGKIARIKSVLPINFKGRPEWTKR